MSISLSAQPCKSFVSLALLLQSGIEPALAISSSEENKQPHETKVRWGLLQKLKRLLNRTKTFYCCNMQVALAAISAGFFTSKVWAFPLTVARTAPAPCEAICSISALEQA